MKNTALLLEQGYCSSHLKNAQLQTESLILEIPFNETISEYDICRFKLIVEEVRNEKQLLLDSAILGEKVSEIAYKNVSFLERDFVRYTHENNLELLKTSENETIQQALKDGVLHEKNSYQKDCIKLNGKYDIKIQVFRQGIRHPDFLSSESPQYVTDYEQKIETITVYVLIFSNSIDIKKNKKFANSSVYGSLGNLGFFMVDLKQFSEFIKNEVGNEPINLVDLFTTTDLVDKSFEEGMLIITWGIKPWHYYIQTMNSSIIFDECIVSGTYKIKKEIKELSVIPGDELLTWPACLEKEWPIIRLEGAGEKIDLSLCTWSGALGNEIIPMYILQRSEDKVENIEPIINYSFF
ncbi:hypothetical protein RQP50_23640 [Paenibacillus sp. chi10]|uniref:Uncharacterized protein n=1 Tax=Paenibacillus suaedae TaxID=3077233 RepID=A0AAJ2K276_9BACL|nr:hypothetical protein [Paenibacillus sp. chi10]MDT8979235.1 hypothetical protein [Paenibacillus sp. chi10]